MNTDFRTHNLILSGKDSRHELGAYISNQRVLVLTDSNISKTQIPGEICKMLSYDNVVEKYDKIFGEPTTTELFGAITFADDFGADCIVGVGGGSVLDTAKVVAAALGKNTSLAGIIADINKNDFVRAKLVLIPTTAGTGSEATPNALFVDGDGNKFAVINQGLLPDITVLDPCTVTYAPIWVKAQTAIDALSHCIEALISVDSTPISKAYSRYGIMLISDNILQIPEEPNVTCIEHLLWGSYFGGSALSIAGTNAVHALAYPLSSLGVSHGAAIGLLLPRVMKYQHAKLGTLLDEVADAMNFGCGEMVVKFLFDILKILPVKKTLAECNVAQEKVPELAAHAIQQQRLLAHNPLSLNIKDMQNIYYSCY